MPPKPRTLTYVPLDDVVPADRNPKTHDPVTTIASMHRFGYLEPLVVDERTGKLLAGHGRCEALADYKVLVDFDFPDPLTGEQLGAPDGVIVDAKGVWSLPVVRGWASADDEEADAAAIALNRGPERGGWDERLLGQMLDELSVRGLDGIGFTDDEMAEVRRRAGIIADEATAFLGSLSQNEATGDAPVGLMTEVPGQNVSAFSLPMSIGDRDEAMKIIRAAQAECGAETMADALLWLLRAWRQP